jgi:uncharacterized protein (TIGR00369 family)
MFNEAVTPCAARDSESLKAIRNRIHPRCVICSPANPMGLAQNFVLQPDGSVESTFVGSQMYEGYPGLLHGGVIAALLDGAMTNCLFAQGVQALTGELTIRYREPVSAGDLMTVCAHLTESRGALHLLRAELRQDGRAKATALGKFVETHE